MSSKRQDSTKTAILLLEILHHIPKRGRITAKTIHERLLAAGHDMTIRTVQRYLKDLCHAFDIECDDRSKPHGYRWLPHAETFNLSGLTPQESLLLRLAQQQLEGLLPAKVMKNLAGFFEQAQRNLDSYNPDYPQKKLEKEWLDKVRVVSSRQPLLPPDIKAGVFEAVSNALYANQWLALKYQNASGTVSSPEVMPLGLAQQGERLYLVCRYKGYDNERSLAMHRIQSAEVIKSHFKRPKFSLAQYDNDGRFLFGDGQSVQLSFCISKAAGEHLYETPLSKNQTITAHEDYLAVTATVVDSQALTWWLNGFGDDVWDIDRLEVEL